MSADHAGRPQPAAKADAAVYKIAFDAGLRALEDQRDELNAIRTRAVSFAALIGSATAFLVGTGLNAVAPNRSDPYHDVLYAGIGASSAGIVLLVATLWPRFAFAFHMSAKTLKDDWINRDVPAPENLLLESLIDALDDMKVSNEKRLKWIRWAYLALTLSGAIGLASWATLVFLQAR